MTRIPPEVQRFWLGALYAEWESVNRNCLQSKLTPPQILLDQATSREGSWTAETRCMTFSVEHIIRSVWVQVALTLRHEVAHQVVDELFGAGGASHHGKLFRRACRLLDLECSSKLPREESYQERRVLQRIRKLMNLARSSNPHEAQAATAAANRLLLRHNIESIDEPTPARFIARWLGKPMRRIPLERKLLSGILQDFYFVRNIWISTTEMKTRHPVCILEVLGRPHNVDIAEYIHDYLLETLGRLWRRYRIGKPRLAHPQAARHSYRVGVLDGFRQQLESQRATSEEQGLIWLGDIALDELFEKRNPSRGRFGHSGYLLRETHEDGQYAGRQIRIRAGLHPESATIRGRLLNHE